MRETYDKINHWYGWNGGKCPVHPETLVTVLFTDGSKQVAQRAEDVFGWTAGNIAAFAILKIYVEPRKPREWWAYQYANGDIGKLYLDAGMVPLGTGATSIVHVREVLPEDGE